MCLCLHLKFKYQAGSAVVIKRAAAPLLPPGAKHARAQEDQPLRTLYTRENMGNTQSNMSISFGSRNLLLSNKETKLPGNAEGKTCSLFWVLMQQVWFICIVTKDLMKRIISTPGKERAKLHVWNEIVLFFFLYSYIKAVIMRTFSAHTRGRTPSDVILKAAICCFRLTGNVRHSSIPMMDPVWPTRVDRGLWWCHSFPRPLQETKCLRTEKEANVDNIIRNKWYVRSLVIVESNSLLTYL